MTVLSALVLLICVAHKCSEISGYRFCLFLLWKKFPKDNKPTEAKKVHSLAHYFTTHCAYSSTQSQQGTQCPWIRERISHHDWPLSGWIQDTWKKKTELSAGGEKGTIARVFSQCRDRRRSINHWRGQRTRWLETNYWELLFIWLARLTPEWKSTTLISCLSLHLFSLLVKTTAVCPLPKALSEM